jgi:hypothetical protein
VINATQRAELPNGFRSRGDYPALVSDTAETVLDAIMTDPRFPGATDPLGAEVS